MSTRKTKTEVASKSKDSVWARTPTPNLVKYTPSGTYYLRGRFGGNPIREALGTEDYQTAKILLADRVEKLRTPVAKVEGLLTLDDALARVRARIANDPTLKPVTRETHFDRLDSMQEGKKAAVPTLALRLLTTEELERWWSGVAGKYSAQRANHILMFVKQALKIARKAKVITDDLSEDLKPLKIPRTRLNLPTTQKFQELVHSIRSQRKTNSHNSADYVEFVAYSGLRPPSEIGRVCGEDLKTEQKIICVRPGKTESAERQVPMVPPMLDLLKRMKEAGRLPDVGKVFTIASPHAALKNACKRLKIPKMRLYDLRHFFATVCNESGVDVPTFSKWLGHKDGGALAMKTYVHPGDEHTQQLAAKVKFV